MGTKDRNKGEKRKRGIAAYRQQVQKDEATLV